MDVAVNEMRTPWWGITDCDGDEIQEWDVGCHTTTGAPPPPSASPASIHLDVDSNVESSNNLPTCVQSGESASGNATADANQHLMTPQHSILLQPHLLSLTQSIDGSLRVSSGAGADDDVSSSSSTGSGGGGGGYMKVVKRDGRLEDVSFDKITARIRALVQKPPKLTHCDPVRIAQSVILHVHDGISTSTLDMLAAETAAFIVGTHPEYGILAARILVSDLHKQIPEDFSDVMERHMLHLNPSTKKLAPLLSQETIDIVRKHKQRLNAAIRLDRDYRLSFFGLKTLLRSFLISTYVNGVRKPLERYQDMIMRESIGVCGDDIETILKCYKLRSEGYYTHGSPVMFNSGTRIAQMSSCFLATMEDDSVLGIYATLSNVAMMSKTAGGVGLAIHNIRAAGTYIEGTQGTSNGIAPMIRVFNDTARYIDQGGGKRKGAFAIYLEPWHADIKDFLKMKRPHQSADSAARDLFYGLWIADLFMERVASGGKWSLFCPSVAPGLDNVWGAEFEALYTKYEDEGRASAVMEAEELWMLIIDSHIETGNPYLVYKDASNRHSNQQNLGTIRSSNLCTEIIEYTAPGEVAVCNLSSIALPKFVAWKYEDVAVQQQQQTSGGPDGSGTAVVQRRRVPYFRMDKLIQVTYHVTGMLNRVVDRTHYPVDIAKKSNLKHRPIAVGVQGLADVFVMMRMPFESDEAKQLNREIFEAMHYGALMCSNDLAKRDGVYESYAGSPISRGIFQMDTWPDTVPSARLALDWRSLRESVAQYGVRNSLLMACMPTATTSQILGNTEGIDALTSNIYLRRVLAGEFMVVNEFLVNDLIELGLWDAEMRDRIIAADGSVQGIDNIPDDIKALYKTVWEISQRDVIDLSRGRAPFICQSQSLNLHLANPTHKQISSMHFYAWRQRLKTGMYYFRTRAASQATKFAIELFGQRKHAAADTSDASGNAILSPSFPPAEVSDGDVCLPGCGGCGA